MRRSAATELDQLRDQLSARLREIYDGASHADVARANLQAFARRLTALGGELEVDVAGDLAEIERAVEAIDGVKVPAPAPAGEPPPWPEIEGAISRWLDANWRCSTLRVIEERAGAAPTGPDEHDLYVTAWVLTERDAHPVLLHITLTRAAAGWQVARVAVAS